MQQPTLQIHILSLRNIHWLVQDHTVRMRFKSKPLESKFSSISITATCRKPNVVKKNSTLPIRMPRSLSSRDSWLKHTDSQRHTGACRDHLEGFFQMVHHAPQGSLIPSLRHHVSFSQRVSHLHCTPALLMCADVYWYCVLSFMCVETEKKFENDCLGRGKTQGNVKASVAKRYKAFRALDRAWIHQERFQNWVAFL